MANFAKLFNLESNQQVLLTVNFEDDNDKEYYELKVRTNINHVEASIKLGFDTEAEALEAMDKFAQTDAVKFRLEMVGMVTYSKN